jgi:hypothetical protein
LVAAQTDNAYGRPLSSYTNDYARYLKILGVRFEMPNNYYCYDRLMAAEPITPAPAPQAPTPAMPSAPEGQNEGGIDPPSP